jgi:DNA/RNA-binding domain of Phe-tRNA-synthetase-like protein
MSERKLFVAAPGWNDAYPGAVAGALAMRGVTNPEAHPDLDATRERLETELRVRYAGLSRADIRTTGHFSANDAYYRRFGQTYHVLLQVDSVVNKGKPIPRRAALVEAAFMAELNSGILTASHDLDALSLPVTVDVATGAERYLLYNGADQACKPGDMYMRDQTGILTNIIAGPAQYARITPETTSVLFCFYAPPGIGEAATRAHLSSIESNVRLIAPTAETIGLVTVTAAGANGS